MIPNPSLVLNKINDITFESYDAPEITDPSDFIVEVKKTGICGSDIHYYTHAAIGGCLEIVNDIGPRILRNCLCGWKRSDFIESKEQGCNRTGCTIQTQ